MLFAKRVGDKPLSRQLGAVKITPGHAGTTDVQFAWHPNGHRLQVVSKR